MEFQSFTQSDHHLVSIGQQTLHMLFLSLLLLLIAACIIYRLTNSSYLPVSSSTLISYDTENKSIITALLYFKSRVKLENLFKLTKAIEQRREFTHLVVVPNYFGWPYFVKYPNFDIKSHIHEVSLESPGTDVELEKLLGTLISKKLDPKKPLWEIYLIRDYYGKGCDMQEGGSVLVFRLHHCLMDGMIAIQFLLSLSEMEHTSTGISKFKRRPRMSLLQTVGSIVASMHKIVVSPQDDKTLFKVDKVSDNIVTSLLQEGISLQEMKQISKEMGATVNDLIISCMSGALGNYLISNVTPQVRKQLEEHPPQVRASLWVSTRKIEWLNQKPSFPKKFDIDIGAVFFDIPLFMKNPIERLNFIKSQSDQILSSAEAYVSKAMLYLLGWIPRPFSCLIWDFVSGKVTFSMSNIPGPQYPVKLCGEVLDRMYFLVTPQRKTSMFICMISYNGRVYSALSCDPQAVRNPHAINKGFVEAFNQVKREK